MKKMRILGSLLMFVLLVALAGCSSQKAAEIPKQDVGTAAASVFSPDTKQAKAQMTKVILYYPDKMGKKLIASEKMIEVSKNKDTFYENTLKALLQPPAKDKGIKIMPKGTQILSAKLGKDKVLNIDFNQAFVKNFGGGGANSIMLIGSIVDTMTQFKEISAVRFYVEGKRLETLGDYDLTEPVKKITNIM